MGDRLTTLGIADTRVRISMLLGKLEYSGKFIMAVGDFPPSQVTHPYIQTLDTPIAYPRSTFPYLVN